MDIFAQLNDILPAPIADFINNLGNVQLPDVPDVNVNFPELPELGSSIEVSPQIDVSPELGSSDFGSSLSPELSANLLPDELSSDLLPDPELSSDVLPNLFSEA